MDTDTRQLWFFNTSKSLSPNVKNNFDSLLKEVNKYGLIEEVIDFTKRFYDEFKADPDGLQDEEQRFMNALYWAMYEWDII